MARDTVQSLLSQFFEQEAAVYANPQLKFAESEAAAARDKLTAAQNRLAEFKSQHNIADLQQQVSQSFCRGPTWKAGCASRRAMCWRQSSVSRR